MPLDEPCDEIEGVEPGKPKLPGDVDDGEVENFPLETSKE